MTGDGRDGCPHAVTTPFAGPRIGGIPGFAVQAGILLRSSSMSLPRQILPGETYLVTRRCERRRFLLTPSPAVRMIFGYCLGVAARKFGILLHAVVVMSNHYHLVLTDPGARLPEFMHWLNEYVAKALNRHYGRCENFWASGSYSAVRLLDLDDVFRKIVYVLANPVSAHLVRTHSEWPGLISSPSGMVRGRWVFERPKVFFRRAGPLPRRVEVIFSLPPGLDGNCAQQWIRALEAGIREEEQGIAAARQHEGQPFLGTGTILSQSPETLPATPEDSPRFHPRVAVRDPRRWRDWLSSFALFLDAYRKAWSRFRAGERNVVFPAGTYAMRVRFGVPCAAPT